MRALILIAMTICLQLRAADSVTNSVSTNKAYTWTKISGTVVAKYPKSIIVQTQVSVKLTVQERAENADYALAMSKKLDDALTFRDRFNHFDVRPYQVDAIAAGKLESNTRKQVYIKSIILNAPQKYKVGDPFSETVKPVTVNGVTCYDCGK